MPDIANTEGAKITTDVKNTPETHSRWAWLKKVASRFRKTSSSAITPPEVNKTNAVLDEKPDEKIPSGSGLDGLVAHLENKGKGVVAERIMRLYPDMLAYLSLNEANLKSEEVEKLKTGLIAGDRQTISTLAGLLSQEYRKKMAVKNQLTRKPNNLNSLPSREKRVAQRQIYQKDLNSPAFKFRLADLLSKEMTPEVSGGMQSTLTKLDKQLAGVTLDPTLPPSQR